MILLHPAPHLLVPTVLPIIITSIIVSVLFLKWKQRSTNLPPCPPPLPIIGHLHLLSLPLHRSFCRLSDRYGRILLLRFGSRPVLVVSSPSAVDECFTKHDLTFANRPRFPTGKHTTYNYTALAAASYGPTWRSLRRIASVEILSPARIRSLSNLLDEEVRLTTKELLLQCNNDGGSGSVKVDMRTKFSELMFNVMMKILAGKRYFGENSDCIAEESRRFKGTIAELFHALDTANPEDHLPFLRWLGFNGHRNRMIKVGREIDQLFQELIEERRREREGEERTIIDVLLSLQETDGEHVNDELIKGMILTLVAAGTHTASGTMEWAMSLLLNHPENLQKVRDEIEKKVGQNHLVTHSEIQNLNYLNNVIKETLRLFPPTPLLLPHESSTECTVEGFTVPSGTMLFANAYAIHRDPAIWTDPTTFKPERFEENELHGSKSYFPFGLGRRSCPGEGLAMVVVSLALGALIQCFEWERIGKEKVDMSEGSGITMHKAKPLEAVCTPCLGIADVINML